jgi:multimeric flavodoxin WrbA
MLETLEKKGVETELINLYDFNVKPCCHCNYECFKQKECPVKDELPKIYQKMRNANGVVLFIPTYGGNASGLYHCWSERSQGIFPEIEEAKRFYAGKVFAIVVVGNVGERAGGEKAFASVVSDQTYMAEICDFDMLGAILLQPYEYRRRAIRGDIIQEGEVKRRLARLAAQMHQRLTKIRNAKTFAETGV